MPRIFISYRRDDAPGHAGRLYDHLRRRFGRRNVFMDVDNILLGENFAAALQQALNRCDVVLVLIGRDWLDCKDPRTGSRRLDDPADWIHVETAEALSRGLPVVPVLVRGASLPARAALPPALQDLADRQATTLSDGQWEATVADLVRRLEAIPRPEDPAAARARARRTRVAAVAAGLLLLIAGAWRLLTRPSLVLIPDLSSKKVADARSALSALGLKVGAVESRETMGTAAGIVLNQTPSPGAFIPRGRGVRLTIAEAPRPVDLSSAVQIRNVGQEGTIAAMAVTVAIEVACSQQGKFLKLSERYLYEKSKLHDDSPKGPFGEGAYLDALFYVAEHFGVPAYETWPYKSSALYRAKDHEPPKSQTWKSLDQGPRRHAQFAPFAGVNDIYDQLRAGRPVIAGFKLTDAWETPTASSTGVVKVDGAIAPRAVLDAGAIAIVGFDPARGILRFAQAWGTSWGDKGFGSMSLKTAGFVLETDRMYAVECASD